MVGGQWGSDLTIEGDISLNATVSSGDFVYTKNGLYVWVGNEEELYTVRTDNLRINIDVTGTNTNGNQSVYANGIYNTWGVTEDVASLEIDVAAHGDNAYVAVAQGVITNNGGDVTIASGTIKAVAENDGYAAQAFGISAESHSDRGNTISSTEALVITLSAINTSTDSNSSSTARGVNSNQDDGAPVNEVTLADTEIHAKSQAAAGIAETVGIYSGNRSRVTVGNGLIDVSATSTSGNGAAYGLYADAGSELLRKGAGDIQATGSDVAVGIYADGGELEYGGGTVTATASRDDSIAVGIYAGEEARISLLGNTDVNASSALGGAGVVSIATDAGVGFNGDWREFTGDLLIIGTAGLGMSRTEAESYTTDEDAAALVLYAGTTLEGRYIVGSDAQADAAASGSSLDLLADGTLVIVAAEGYDGRSPLVTVDHASAESTSVVRLVNSARVEGGTVVFETSGTEAPEGYVFETDNLLTEVVGNRLVKKSAEDVFGSGLLMPNVVEAALSGATGTGADRIIALTSDSYTTAASGKMLNRIALMGAAGGAQIAALNASVMADESIMRHGAAFATKDFEPGRANLWVDLNGSFSRAHEFKAGAGSYGFKSDLAGGMLGADYALDGGVVGAALSFGTGSVRGQAAASGTKNEVDYWGVHLYGAWDAGIFNVIGSVGWLQTKNDISQSGFKGEPDVSAIVASARLERAFEIGAGYVATPHIGVRWTHIDLDDFSAGGFDYRGETANLVAFPFGVAFSNAFATAGGLDFMPYLDLEIAPMAGDKSVENRVGLVGSTAEDMIDTRIASSVVYSAKFGLTGSVGESHAFSLYYGVSAGNGDYVAQYLKAGYRYAF